MCSSYLSASQLFLLWSFHRVSHAGTFGGPMGPPASSRYFWSQPRTHRSDPLNCGVLSSWFLRLMIPVRGLDISILASLLGSGWGGLVSSPRSLLCPPAPAWVALGGAGPQDPGPRLPGRLLALPPREPPHKPPARIPRGCLIKAGTGAHSWVWFFAVSGCSLGAVGEARVTGQSDSGCPQTGALLRTWACPDQSMGLLVLSHCRITPPHYFPASIS